MKVTTVYTSDNVVHTHEDCVPILTNGCLILYRNLGPLGEPNEADWVQSYNMAFVIWWKLRNEPDED